MVTVSGVKKSSGMKSSLTSYSSFTTGLNRIGATLNSVVIVNQQVRDAMVQNLRLRTKELDENKKRFVKEKSDKGKNSVGKKPFNFGKFAKVPIPDFFAGLAGMASFIMKAVIGQALLRWIANPQNQNKLVRIWEGISKIFQWLAKFITENLYKTIDGLMTMFDENASFWDRLKGFGSFISGFGALLLGYAFLKKPKLILSGIKFVLTTLWKSLTSTIKALRGRTGGNLLRGAAAVAPVAATLGTAALLSAAANEVTGQTAAAPVQAENKAKAQTGRSLGVQGVGGVGDLGPTTPTGLLQGTQSPISGDRGSQSSMSGDNKPSFNKDGGVATKPTKAVIGERGPELKIPLTMNTPIPGDNKKRMKDSGIKPLSSLGNVFGKGGAKPDADKSKKLSDLFMAPFKGIGAGLLSNIVAAVSGMGPVGQAITPILGNIIAPIANSFGVPSSLVKSISSKVKPSTSPQDTKANVTGKAKSSGNLSKLFGKGKPNKETGKEFRRKGDNSVLGLLTDILGASQVISNKLGGENPPGFAAGGWISGPHSGYPVSLDGGGSTSFIGHGTEWVGFKRASGGSAFVVPFDTPATKNNPRLTESRMRQAKTGGFALPGYAKGGTINGDPRWKGDTGPNSRWAQVVNTKTKSEWARRNKNKFADGGKIAEAAKSMVGTYFGQDGCAKSTRAMLAKAGVAPNPIVTSKVLDKGTPGAEPTGTLKANSFGPDQGAVVKSSGQVQAGDIVMWNTGGGVIGHVGVAIGNGQVVHNSSSAGYKLAKMPVTGMTFHSAIRLGATGTATGDTTSDTTGDTSGDKKEWNAADAKAAQEKELTSAFAMLKQGFEGIIKPSEVAAATDATKQAKDKAVRASNSGIGAVIASTTKQTATPPPQAPPQTIILPSTHKRTMSIEQLYNPKTSMFQYTP